MVCKSGGNGGAGMIRILKRLFHMMKQHKGRLYLGIVLSMVNNILGIVPIICVVWTITVICDAANGLADLRSKHVFYLLGVIIGSILVRWLFSLVRAS